MRKSIAKLMCLLLLLVFVFTQFSFTLNVKAISVKGENSEGIRADLITDNATITVTDVDSADTFVAYKILDSFYNSETNEVTHEFTGDFNTFLNTDSIKELYPDFTIDKYMELTSDYIDANGVGQASSSVITTSTLNVLISKYATYISTNNIEGTSMVTNGSNATATVQAGSYLVLPTQTTRIYSVMVGNATYEAKNGEWILNNPTIVSKHTSYPTVQNYVADPSIDLGSDLSDIYANIFLEEAYMIGQNYLNGIDAQCFYYPVNAINRLCKFEILLDEGVEFAGLSSIVIWQPGDYTLTADENGDVYYEGQKVATAYVDGKKITVEIDLYTLDEIDRTTSIGVLFTTKLNENATLGPSGNKTTVNFYYANEPYDLTSSYSIESFVTTYTYGVEIQNYGDEAKTKLLDGSEFEIYSDSELKDLVGEIKITDGKGTLKGIADGTYYLKQKTATTGYKLLSGAMPFEISVESDYTTIEVINAETGFLPSTGGIGTIIYTVIGLLIIGVASFAVIYYRKKQLKVNS